MNNPLIHIIGAGLAGSECALQLAERGFQVRLYEMRPETMTPAHRSNHCAELVCSNSFGSLSEVSAPGLLKWEAEQFQSFILRAAKTHAVPAGQALGIDRENFAADISKWIQQHPRIEICTQVVTDISNLPRPCVVATGPLTHESLIASLQHHFSTAEFLYFFDAIAPIIDADSIDYDVVWRADRYDKGTPDYLNCPLDKEQYLNLIQEIKSAKKVEPKDFEKTNFFEGCMPVEAIVARGDQTLRFGPMKPVGLTNPKTGRYPYAALQLRQENREATSYNMVGFQTRMTYGEQQRVFRMIPGLEKAEFLKLGSMHRNLFLNTPTLLNVDLSSRQDPWLFFAGQITGVEGYFESTCTGILVARFLEQKLRGLDQHLPSRHTAFGSLLHAITDPERAKHFQPTNINFGLLPPLEITESDKSKKKQMQVARAKEAFANL